MKKIVNLLLVLFPMMVISQTVTQNYIKTATYKVPTQTRILAPTITQANQSVNYFDGLGRPVQQVQFQQSASGKDIVTPTEYDAFGRQVKEYLPYASTQSTAGYIDPATLITNLTAQYKTNYGTINANPFSEKQLELSPLSRVLKEAAPGNDWKLNSGHEIKINYQTNTASEVKLFTAAATWSASLGLYDIAFGNASGTTFYSTNDLYKTITYDENTAAAPVETAGATVEFKNKKGQVILKRTYDAGVKHDTYYVYDIYGNLTYVIPPKADAAITQAVLDNLCYQYKYDHRNRLVEKKLPGKQWEFIVYDKLDRPVATGPAASPFNDLTSVGWLITKYDAFNRPVYTGWMTSTPATGTGRKTLQDAQNAPALTVINESKQTSGTIDGIAAYYTNTVAPATFKLLTVNYYDNYTFPSSPVITIPTSVEGQTVLTAAQVKGLTTASWTRILTSSTAVSGETTATFYDAKARAIRTYSQNYLGGYTYTDTNLDFAGVPQYTVTYHKRTAAVAELKTKEAFTYSPQGRLLTQTHQINTGTVELIASNSYDELGQLITKKTGNVSGAATALQNINYAYNIRGWMTEINKTGSLTQSGDPKDLFAFKINYNTISTGISGVNSLYNGNIAETFWNTADVTRAYGYKYDNLNRLKDAVYQKTAVLNAYNESLTYDKNGNIMSLLRNGTNETATAIDNLVYSYGPTNATNQLTKVADSSNKTLGFVDSAANSVDDYSYDANGNMTKDNNKNITAITYNHLNLPTKITFATTGNIVYIYNAAGQKVQKVVTITSPASTTTTDYLGGYQYLNTVLQFFPTAEGYVEAVTASSFKYVYQYKDHLGNVRLSYKDNDGNGSIATTEILEQNDYYPFGLKHTGYGPAITSTNSALKYKYNSKELQDELGLNMYDYGARNYDPALGRWMNIDPLAEKSRRWSPYTYALNNPIFFIDPDGMEAMSPIYDPKGNFLGTDENGLKGDAVVMKKEDFTQGMSKEDAESKNLGQEGFKDDKSATKAYNHFSGLKDRPDYDGKLTLKEANAWFRNGGGEPLFVDAAKVNLSPVETGDFESVGSSQYKNFFLTSNQETGAVYGTIKLTLEDDNGTVKIGGKGGYLDTYDFEQKKSDGTLKRELRNIGTKAGAILAGDGTGYKIYNYGKGKVEKTKK